MKTNTSQTVEFTVEKEETIVIRRYRDRAVQRCHECGADIDRAATPETNLDERKTVDLIDEGQ